MNKEFVPYQESLELKELGFDEECFGYYNFHKPIGNSPRGFCRGINIQDHNCENEGDDLICSAVLFQQAFRWFREKYQLDSFCRTLDSSSNSYWKISKLYDDGNIKGYSGFHKSYEEAELELLRQLIKIVQENEQTS